MIKRSSFTRSDPSPATSRATRSLARGAGGARRWCLRLGGLTAAAILAACGGGDGATTGVATPAPVVATTTLSGSVVKGPVAGAQVCGFSISGNARGAALGSCVATDASGAYTLVPPAGSGPLPGLTIDTANRRISFVNVVIGSNASKSLTLNGTIDYPTNVAPENRAACG